MRNISALKWGQTPGSDPICIWIGAGLLVFFLSHPVSLYATSPESLKQAVVQAYEESSKPIFSPEEADRKPPVEDKFFEKIRSDRADFYREERDRKREFLDKIRKKTDWSDEKRQKEIAEYHQDEMERLEKFMKKQQKKIDKQHRTISL